MLQFFFEGDDFYQSLEDAVKKAKSSIKMEVYIFKSDKTGWRLADLLVRKLKEGIKVWLLYDAVGCFGTDAKLFDALKETGAFVARYNALFPPTRYFQRRDHRKMIIIDGQLTYLGGFNIGDEYSKLCTFEHAWRDTGVA